MDIFTNAVLGEDVGSKRYTSIYHFHHRENGQTPYTVILLRLKGSQIGHLDSISKFIWNRVSDFLHSSTQLGVGSVEGAIDAAKEAVIDLLKNEEHADEGLDLDLGVVQMQEGFTVAFGLIGDITIAVHHDMRIINLSEILKANSTQTGSSRISDTSELILTTRDKDLDEFKEISGELFEKIKEDGDSAVHISFNDMIAIEMAATQDTPEVDSEDQVETEIEDAPVEEIVEDPPTQVLPGDELSEELDSLIQDKLPADMDEVNTDTVSEDQVKDDSGEGEGTLSDDASKGIEDPTDTLETETDENANLGSDSVSEPIKAQPKPEDLVEEIPTNSAMKDDSADGTGSNQDASPKGTGGVNGYRQVFDRVVTAGGGLAKDGVKGVKSAVSNMPSRGEVSEWSRNIRSWVNRYLRNSQGRRLWVRKFKARISQMKFSSFSIKGLKLSHFTDRKERSRRFMGVFVVIVVLVGLYMAYSGAKSLREQSAVNQAFDTLVEEIESDLDTAQDKAKSDRSKSEVALFKVEEALDGFEYQKDDLNSEDQSQYDEINSSIQDVRDILDFVDPLDDDSVDLFLDTHLKVDADSDPRDMALFRDERGEEFIYFTDAGVREVYELVIYSEELSILQTIDDFIEPAFIDVSVNGVYVYDIKNGIYSSSNSENQRELERFKTLDQDAWGAVSPQDLAILTNSDHIYLLDSGKNALMKAQNFGGFSYGLPTVYIQDEAFSSVTDTTADFSLYFTFTDEPQFKRYIYSQEVGRQVEAPLSFTGGDLSEMSLTASYTADSLDAHYYVFDSKSKRFLVYEKPNETAGRHVNEMVLKRQLDYRGDEDIFNDVKDFVVDHTENFMYVLDGQKIWRIKLK